MSQRHRNQQEMAAKLQALIYTLTELKETHQQLLNTYSKIHNDLHVK